MTRQCLLRWCVAALGLASWPWASRRLGCGLPADRGQNYDLTGLKPDRLSVAPCSQPSQPLDAASDGGLWPVLTAAPLNALDSCRPGRRSVLDRTLQGTMGFLGMSGRILAYLFRHGHFAPDGNTVVSVAARDVVVSIYGGGGTMDGDGLDQTFGGYCVFRADDTGACFLGVWGARNASRFRNDLRRGGILLELVRGPPPARLVLWSTADIRPERSGAGRAPDQITHAEGETSAC